MKHPSSGSQHRCHGLRVLYIKEKYVNVFHFHLKLEKEPFVAPPLSSLG